MEQFRYLGTNLTNHVFINEEIKSTLNSGNACCHPVQNLFSSGLLSKNTKFKIYWTITIFVVLCGCGTWSFTLREERRLRMFENRVLNLKRDEVARGWRRLYSSPNIIRAIKSRGIWSTRFVALTGDRRDAYRGLLGRSKGQSPLGRPRRRCDDNIKMDL